MKVLRIKKFVGEFWTLKVPNISEDSQYEKTSHKKKRFTYKDFLVPYKILCVALKLSNRLYNKHLNEETQFPMS